MDRDVERAELQRQAEVARQREAELRYRRDVLEHRQREAEAAEEKRRQSDAAYDFYRGRR